MKKSGVSRPFPEDPAATGESAGFRRELGLWSSTMIVIGSMIGSGIFIVSADIARNVGSPGHLLLVWGLTGVMTVLAALSYGELAGMMPHVGGQYVYLREAYNPLVGFLFGWTMFMVIQTGTIAAVAVAFAKFNAVFFPALGENVQVVPGLKVSAAQVVAILSIAGLTWLNTHGLHIGKLVQNLFTSTKVMALVGLILLGCFVGWNLPVVRSNLAGFWQASWTTVAENRVTVEPISGWMLLAAIGVSMVGSLFSSDAWNNITFTAGEVIRPRRTIPLSLFLGTLTVTMIYLLTNLAYLVVLPVRGRLEGGDVITRGIQFALSDRVGTAAASVVLGEPAVLVMAALIMVSTFGCNNGLILSGARLFYVMAWDGLFFSHTATLNKKRVPAVAQAFQGFWASLLCLTGTYNDLLDYVIFAVLIFYALTIAGIFVLRVKRPEAERPYRAWGYPVVPVLYIVAAGAICLALLIFKPLYTWPGVGIVLLGIPVYYVWRRLERRSG